MNKKRIFSIAGVFLILIAVFCLGAYALSSLNFHQNPVVPSQGTSFTTNPTITEGSDQTALWTWNPSSNSFSAMITLTNNGNSAWLPQVTCPNAPNGWTFSTSTLTSISPQGTLQVTIAISHGTVPLAGPIGDFTVAIN